MAEPDAPGDGAPAGATPAARADFFFCLAAAFRPPPAGMQAAQWCTLLADDLADLAPAIGPCAARAIDALRAFATGPGGGCNWLVEYSRLFLVPPVKVTLNCGVYLEGGLAGSAAQMISGCYARAGFAARADFHDLPDHVALQLEFLGALLERAADGDAADLDAAGEFVDAFVAGWAEPLRDACARAAGHGIAAAQPFGALAQLLVDALELGDRSPAR
jgi:TorA maturation chaperone TorD